MIRKCLNNIDTRKASEMLLGLVGIYFSFLLLGVIFQKITSTQYYNSNTGQQDNFRITCGLIFVQRSLNWLFGSVFMYATVAKQERVRIPIKNSAIVGFLIWMSTITQTEAMYLVSYPFIMMAKACSLISVILVGVCCSRVRNKEIKLGPEKIVIAVIVSLGIVMFRVFDPAADFDSNKSTQIVGLILLLLSLFADGFVPDFQAQIKEKFNPTSIQMLVTINKCCAIFALVYLLAMWQITDFIKFCIEHAEFTKDLLLMSIASFVGQIFIYRMIKVFKQHIVPFVVTTRKILTVGLSIIYFKHETSIGQIISIFLVFGITMYEFFQNITRKKKDAEEEKEEKKLTTHVELAEELESAPKEIVKA